MLKLSQPQKIMIILLIAFIFILPFTNILGSPGTIISQSSVVLKNELRGDGKLYTISTISIDTDTNLEYVMMGATKTLPDGTKIVTGGLEMFYIKANKPECKYQLKANPIKVGDTILFNYYTFNSVPSRSQVIDIKNMHGKSIQVSAYDYTDKILPDSDGKGFASVRPQGTWQGEKDCVGDISNKVIVVDKNGYPRVLQADAWQYEIASKIGSYCTNPLFLITGDCQRNIENIRYGTNLPSHIYSPGWNVYEKMMVNPSNAELKTQLVGTINSVGNPVIVITADEDYFESVRYAPGSDIVTPEIISFSNNEALEETITSYLLIVKNPSLSEKTFSVKITPKYGSVSQTSYQLKIAGGQQYKQTIIYSAPSVTSNVQEVFTIEVCDNWQVPSASKCSVRTETRTIKNNDAIIPITNVKKCGDNVCSAEIGETKSSCPQDCGNEPTPTPTSCKEIDNSIYSSDAKDCVCSVGFDTKYNPNTGKMYCEKPQDIYGLVLVILGALILGVVVYTTLIKKGRGR
jgi:hypothetical protein